MALPKRRQSKSRRDKRRNHHGLTAPALMRCSHCRAYTRTHNACPACGYYQGEKIDHTVTEKTAAQHE
jgi:large subunit ribosomal protein L32